MSDHIDIQATIDALEKVAELSRQGTTSDCISRQAAIDVLSLGKEILSRVLDDMDVVGTDRDKYSWGIGLIESNIEDIKELPSAQPERKLGEWIYDGDCYICNQCKSSFNWWADCQASNFCPNCGADMREVKE